MFLACVKTYLRFVFSLGKRTLVISLPFERSSRPFLAVLLGPYAASGFGSDLLADLYYALHRRGNSSVETLPFRSYHRLGCGSLCHWTVPSFLIFTLIIAGLFPKIN